MLRCVFRTLHKEVRNFSAVNESFILGENKRYANFLKSHAKLHAALMDEAVGMLIPEGMTAPELNKGYFYFQRTESDSGMLRFCRVPADVGGKLMNIESSVEEEILSLSDVAANFSDDHNYCSVSVAKICVENKLLGFISDVAGDERWTLRFRDIAKKKYFGVLPFVRNFEWIDNTLTGGKFFYYTAMDPMTLRSTQIVHARLDEASGKICDQKVVWEAEEGYLDLVKSKDGAVIFFSAQSEVRMVSATDCGPTPVVVAAPQRGVEYYCEHSNGFVYMVSNKDYTNFALYKAKLAQNELQDFELVHHSTEMAITEMDVFRRGIVLYGHGFEGQPAVEILRSCNDLVRVPFKGNYAIGKIEIGVNGDFEAEKCRFIFRSPKNPGTCLEFDFADRKIEAVKTREFQRKWTDMADIHVRRVHVSGVPLTLVSLEETCGPCLVHVYGAYGTVLEPDFSPAVLSLVRRGWTVAFAHVRGGGECGPEWHQAGVGLNRWNAVNDFKSCCDWLVSEGITTNPLLSAVGASAGGVVLGAALNKWGTSLVGGPSILRVPFVDLFDTLADPTLPLSLHEREEWGDVNKDATFIRGISPIDNIVSNTSSPKWYPPLLISCAQDDTRVPFEGVVRYAEKLMKSESVNPNTFVNTRGSGGHFGADNYDETCAELAFLLHPGKY